MALLRTKHSVSSLLIVKQTVARRLGLHESRWGERRRCALDQNDHVNAGRRTGAREARYCLVFDALDHQHQ